MAEIVIRPPVAGDREAWGRLYAAYAEFYGVVQDEAMRDRVWSWTLQGEHEIMALVAEQDGILIGLAHFRAFARPLSATVAGFLDDLFVDPASRGSGAAEALIAAVAQVGRDRGWSVVRWLTNESNYRARALYDRLATPTPWRVYDLKP
jgi:GNAT superfamily N-acetyltransferase